ncbi:putative serine hydrolase FSH [Heracleum sosnowskyi]|uniref:Serine hydrolase FSH n=1 Tax=Heracleum sosnowskyi TaxID=360622 RepID=A0AAD8MJW0_9APIA|nr:putative serine hydrolase FSH [Heracleum sosnowskyi]
MMKYKVLCLHGSSSTAALLKKELEIWPSNVLEKMDFVFVDAPFPSNTEPDSKFTWYYEDPTKLDSTFSESIAYIEETMVKFGPFDGVVGFSQGATVTATLPGMQAQGVALTKVEGIKFVMLISGAKLGGFRFPAAPKLAQNAFSSRIEIPSRHCFGESDLLRLPAVELMGSFVDPFVIDHSGGHEIPKLDEKGLKVMISFLDKIQETYPTQYS